MFFINHKSYIASFSFLVIFFIFSSPIYADSYEYFSPVIVGSNPKRSPPTEINNSEDKDSTVYSNDIDQSPVTCSYENQVTQSVEPEFDIIDQIKHWLETEINSLTETKTNSTYTNKVFRDTQLQYAKDPSIKLDATNKDKSDSFKNFDATGRNTTVRTQPYKNQLISKGQYLEEAVLSLTKSNNVIALDEAIAWNCQGKCQDLFDELGKKPNNCSPITLSEVAYYFYKNGKSTSYRLENGRAVNIPYPNNIISVFDDYQTYRSQFKSFAPDSCYQTLYKNLPTTPRGTVNTKYVFYNNENGVLAPTPAYRAVPLAAALTSEQTATTLGLFLPKNQDGKINKDAICQNFKSSSPISDQPSPINFLAFIRAFIKKIVSPETITRPIKTDLVLPETLVENLDKDSKFLDNFIPAKVHQQKNFKNVELASIDQNSNARIPDAGYKNSLQREYFARFIIPKSWQQKQSGIPIINPPSTDGTINPNVHKWCTLITKYSQSSGISSDTIAALINVESQGNPQSYSSQGAVGLMQIMPKDGIAAELFPGLFVNRPTIAELYDPEFNIQYGTNLLKKYSDYWGGLREGLLHYGPTGIGYAYADAVLSLAEANKNYCQ